MEKVIRIWNGCKVVQLLFVSDSATGVLGSVGGASNSTKVDIELDPWAGLIVDHSVHTSPVNFRDEER
jgi:hypothetical protein